MGTRPLLNATRAVARGFGVGLAFILVLTLLSGLLMSRGRAERVARGALESDGLEHPFAHRDEDYFTECALLVMLTSRTDNLARHVVETWLPPETLAFGHPCETLRRYVDGEIRYSPAPDRLPYVSYWFGSRHLEAVVLRFLTFSQAQVLYRLLSYGAVLVLALASWRSDRRTALVLVPVFASLLLAFELHLHGHNLAHAPGFFVGFLLLAFLVARRRRFQGFEARLSFFAFLAVVASFFDLLNGPILVMLSLSLVLNHLFYCRNRHWRDALWQLAAIAACFALCYAMVTVVRLSLLDLLYDGVWRKYLAGLSVRLGSEVDPTTFVGPRDSALELWTRRGNLDPGGTGPSTFFLLAGALSWLFAIARLPLAVRKRGGGVLLTDVAVVAVAGLGVLAWYVLFPNHTFVHARFAVRYVALPTAYGGVAALLPALRPAAPRPSRDRALAAGALSRG